MGVPCFGTFFVILCKIVIKYKEMGHRERKNEIEIFDL